MENRITWDDCRRSWLALAWFAGFGSRTLRRLMEKYAGDGEKALGLSRADLRTCGVSEGVADKFIIWRATIDPLMFARRCDDEDISFLMEQDAGFPPALQNSSHPPACLFVRGASLDLRQPIAVVGTRAMTPYGARATEHIVQGLVQAGCEIVSGLALGIDAKAHDTALTAHGKTVAIVAGGCNDDALSPRRHIQLAKRILAHGGTIFSEFPPGTEILKHFFPLRNRLIASLCLATVVVEAAEASGSLITARLALEENRDVFAVPGPITHEQSAGTNNPLKLGAIPCTQAEDVLQACNLSKTTSTVLPEVTADEQRILKSIHQPLHIDDIIRRHHTDASQVTSHIATLELKGLIHCEGGRVYARTPKGRMLFAD